MRKFFSTLGTIALLLLGGCGTYTLANGNELNFTERLGIMAGALIVEETTADGAYVGHDIFPAGGVLPPLLQSGSSIGAARSVRPSRVDVDNSSVSDVDVDVTAEGGGFIPPGHINNPGNPH